MKKLILFRHSKTEPAVLNQTDHERPLKPKGLEDCQVMGHLLKQKAWVPDAILTSSALRAVMTAEKIAQMLKIPATSLIKEADIYNADCDTLLNVIRNLSSEFQCPMVVGHNPGMSELACYISGEKYVDLPTSGVFLANMPISDWGEVKRSIGDNCQYLSPSQN